MEYRLIEEYEKYHNLIIGFDFDNTICGLDNESISKVIFLLQECKKLGFTLCLYTISTSEEWLAWKVKYCDYFRISPDYVNDSDDKNKIYPVTVTTTDIKGKVLSPGEETIIKVVVTYNPSLKP